MYYASDLPMMAEDARGTETTLGYDQPGRPTQATVAMNTPVQATLSMTYDALGRKTSETDGNGHTTSFSYYLGK